VAGSMAEGKVHIRAHNRAHLSCIHLEALVHHIQGPGGMVVHQILHKVGGLVVRRACVGPVLCGSSTLAHRMNAIE
jgi:hypothetical protein